MVNTCNQSQHWEVKVVRIRGSRLFSAIQSWRLFWHTGYNLRFNFHICKMGDVIYPKGFINRKCCQAKVRCIFLLELFSFYTKLKQITLGKYIRKMDFILMFITKFKSVTIQICLSTGYKMFNFSLFETGSTQVAQSDLQLTILLSQPSFGITEIYHHTKSNLRF